VNLALWGRSMGAATSIMYSATHPGEIKCMILDSPFSDLYALSEQVVAQMQVSVIFQILEFFSLFKKILNFNGFSFFILHFI
jgi:pimeloyl-ACP methyl ester carboxylesterase